MFVLVGSAATALTFGSANISIQTVLHVLLHRLPGIGAGFASGSAAEQLIILSIRLPRVVLAVCVGGALASAGAVMQGLFHNPMAEPYVMGVSAGAALGATIGFVLRLDVSFLGLGAVPLLAFLGGLGTTILVVNLGRVGSKVPLTVVLLAGIAVGSFLSAINSMFMIFNRDDMHQIVFWIMGGFSGRGWEHVYAALPYMVVGLAVMGLHLRELNLIALGEEKAQQLGLEAGRVQFFLIAAASLVTAAAVSVSGIIGFVGLIVPHVVRLIIGPDHRYLLPTSCLLGGVFLLAADTLARTVLSPMELPVGVITALAGAPFFLYLLNKTKHGM